MKNRIIGICMCAVICAGLLAGCGGGGGSSSGSAGSGADGQTQDTAEVPASSGDESGSAHEETVIHADQPVKAMFEALYEMTGKGHEAWIEQMKNPAFKERTVYDEYGVVREEPVMLSAVPVSWNGGRILDLERVHEGKGPAYIPYGLNNSIDFQEADGGSLNYTEDGYEEKARALRKSHPEYQGVFWCELRYVAQDNDEYYYQRYLYEVEGDELVLTPVMQNFLDVETGDILYMDGAEQERFQYEFKDGKMVLRQGDCEALLYNNMEAYRINNDKEGDDWLITCEGVSRLGYEMLDDIVYIRFSKGDAADHDRITSFELLFNDDSRVTANAAWDLRNLTPGSGVEAESYGNYVHLTWAKKDNQQEGEETPGELTFQYIDLSGGAGVCGRGDGLILVQDGKVYQYNSNYYYYERRVANSFTEGSQELTETTAEKLFENQQTIISRLQEAFENAGIAAQIDEESGIVRFDANILFDKDSADLSEDGKKTLDSFTEVYAGVMEEALEEGLITNVMIDGYADPDGDYDYNMDLSQRRAESVLAYCLEKEPSLESITKAEGHSFDNLILKDDGSIDADASRRVEFRFILKVD